MHGLSKNIVSSIIKLIIFKIIMFQVRIKILLLTQEYKIQIKEICPRKTAFDLSENSRKFPKKSTMLLSGEDRIYTFFFE